MLRFWLLACFLLCCAASLPAAAERPNIILILTDDQGWGDGRVFGHPYLQTPAIDRLAREGTWFQHYYCPAPVCSPSRAGILTGRHPARLGIHGHFGTPAMSRKRGMPLWLDPALPTLARSLQAAGYRTAHLGKWHLASRNKRAKRKKDRWGDAPAPTAYGFDVSHGYLAPGPQLIDTDDRFYRAKSTHAMTEAAINIIDAAAAADQPFFINYWTLVPHTELRPTKAELAVYADLDVDPAAFPPATATYLSAARDPTGQVAVQCAALTGMDAAIGRLLDHLDIHGLTDDTIVVFTSDNGPEDYHIKLARHAGTGSAGPLRARKRSLYDGGIRTPLVVRWPGVIPAGAIDTQTVIGGVDLYPTLAAAAGIDVPVDIDGEDRLATWRGESAPRQSPLFWEWRYEVVDGPAGAPDYQPPSLAIRHGRYKCFVDGLDGGRPAELYDLLADPEERQDLAAEQPEVLADLVERLRAWQAGLP